MPQIVDKDGKPLLFKAMAEDGEIVAQGYLELPFIPEGQGGQIVSGIQFVTIGQSGSGISPDDAARILTAGNPTQ